MISRRDWLRSVGVAIAGASGLGAQQQQAPTRIDTSNLFPMDQAAARTVLRAPKPGASASMSPDDRDALEHRIRCQCGCTLDVFTCRTTDFSCQVSPAMHRDIMALVAGGYGAQEILDAFVGAYGEAVLMAPPKAGFNLVGYLLPGVVVAVGAIVLAVIIRGLGRPVVVAGAPVASGLDATPEEVARIEAAVRDDA